MNDRSLSRRLSNQVVEALKAHGHVLVVKGGATALARELDDMMSTDIDLIEPRLWPRQILTGEPTSTFGDESVDQAVEEIVDRLTRALMSSDHVEDVFAEDAVIRRDIFRAIRDGLRDRPVDTSDASEPDPLTIKLDTLGYVAATASRRAEPSALRKALDRAATEVGAQFAGFSAELREATFRLDHTTEDERLELEEAVADELTDLVREGIVELPSIERTVDLGRAVSLAEQKSVRSKISSAADATLRGSGCAAAWELSDLRTIRIRFTPLSDHDGDALDGPTNAFAREVANILSASAASAKEGEAPRSKARSADEAPTPASRTTRDARKTSTSVPTPTPTPEPASTASKRAGAPKRAATKRATKPRATTKTATKSPAKRTKNSAKAE